MIKKVFGFSLLISPLFSFASNECDISGLDKKEVLRALYAEAKPQGFGFLRYQPEGTLTDEEASKIIERGDVDYLHGRVMKITFNENNTIFTRSYNRDNGSGKAEAVIALLKQKQQS